MPFSPGVSAFRWSVIASLALAACASTSVVSSEKNPAYTGPALTRLMVLGSSPNPNVRKAFEEEFVSKLKAAGITAVPSYPVVPPGADQNELRRAVENAGMEGVLAARLVRPEVTDTALDAFNFENRSASFYAYYSPGANQSLLSNLSGGSGNITIHFDVYSVAANELVWAGDAATYPSTDVKVIAAGLAYTVIPALKQQKVL